MMKTIILGIAAVFLMAAGWIEGGAVGVPTDNSKKPVALWMTTRNSITIPDIPIPPNEWVTIDLSNGPQWSVNNQPDLPEDTKAVFLSGIHTLTHAGTNPKTTCGNKITFRAPGDDLVSGAYQVQVIEATPGNGQRQNAALWVPVVDRKFEVFWNPSPPCSYTVNLSLQAYVR